MVQNLYQLRIQTVDLKVNFHYEYKVHNKEHLYKSLMNFGTTSWLCFCPHEPDIYVLPHMRSAKAKTGLHIYVVSPKYLLPKMSLSMRTIYRQPLVRLDCCACILSDE